MADSDLIGGDGDFKRLDEQGDSQDVPTSASYGAGDGVTGEESMDGSAVANNGDGFPERKLKGKNEEKKIFVGGIGWDTTEEDLRKFFGQFGEVAHVQVKYDHFTGRSRGFAFVEFTSGDACREALKLKDREIKGKKCEVKPAKSRENKKIFIGGLPSDFPEEELRGHFEQFGHVDEIEWPYDKFQNKRKNFAFVVFEDEEAAARAAANSKQKFGERICDVKIAVPQYMRPQKPQLGNWSAYSGTGGAWGDYSNYSSYGYGGYGGGYNYYDDRFGGYDYSGYATGGDYSNNWQGFDGWGYSGGGATVAGSGGGGSGHRGRGGYTGANSGYAGNYY